MVGTGTENYEYASFLAYDVRSDSARGAWIRFAIHGGSSNFTDLVVSSCEPVDMVNADGTLAGIRRPRRSPWAARQPPRGWLRRELKSRHEHGSEVTAMECLAHVETWREPTDRRTAINSMARAALQDGCNYATRQHKERS